MKVLRERLLPAARARLELQPFDSDEVEQPHAVVPDAVDDLELVIVVVLDEQLMEDESTWTPPMTGARTQPCA